MNTTPLKAVLTLLTLSAPALQAGQSGLFQHTPYGGSVIITGYPKNATGHVEIPTEIDGHPVVGIGTGAFARCTQITSVTIPEGITYHAETSTDLKTWTTNGITLSGPDPRNHRTASIPSNSQNRFLRLVVTQ
jgi:hypothetical protein